MLNDPPWWQPLILEPTNRHAYGNSLVWRNHEHAS